MQHCYIRVKMMHKSKFVASSYPLFHSSCVPLFDLMHCNKCRIKYFWHCRIKYFLIFFPIQYETIWTNKKPLILFENIIAMFFKHIKTIIILACSKIRNNSKFITCAWYHFFFHNFDKQRKTSSNSSARVSIFFEHLIIKTKHNKE